MGCLFSVLRTTLQTNAGKDFGGRDGQSISQLYHMAQNTMNDNNSNSKATDNSEKNSK